MSDGVLVTIILTESTASTLGINVQNVEEISESLGSMWVIDSLYKTDLFKRNSNRCLLEYLFGSSDSSMGQEVAISVAYFSNHFNPDFDEMNEDDEIEMIDESEELTPEVVYTRPLVAAKSAAHDDKIAFESNKILLTATNEELSLIEDFDWMCRICHGGESLGDLLSPCRCRGSIALAHIACLERWLKESSNSYCELCKHHYQIVRQPMYNVPWSVVVYLGNPGDNLKDIVFDLLALILYTPSAIACTYMLMLICENVTKSQLRNSRNLSAHLVAFCAVFGMAAIDFTYSSWLIVTFQKHVNAWKSWYRTNSFLKLILPEWKRKPYRQSQYVKDH